MILYLLTYFLVPAFIVRFGLNGDPFGGIAELIEMVILTLVLITILSAVFIYRITNEIKYFLLNIPVYIMMHILMFSIDFEYSPLIGFGDFDVDVFLIITFMIQLVVCAVVRFVKSKKNTN